MSIPNDAPTYVTPADQPGNSLGTTLSFTSVKSISLHSGTHACALSITGAVKCWGSNDSGQLGLGDVIPRGSAANQMGAALPAVSTGLEHVTDVVAGTNISCVVGGQGEVKCWGANESGQLGAGDTLDRGKDLDTMGLSLPIVPLGVGRQALQVSPGADHVCALLDNGGVRCWGNNQAGQLGVGDTQNRGDAPSELGDGMPLVNLGSGRLATYVGSGTQFSCALLDNAQVKCWGLNTAGQLGVGDTTNRGPFSTDLGDSLPPLNFGPGATVAALSVGQTHSCVLLASGQVKCWGDNSSCNLGLGDQTNRGGDLTQMGSALPVVQLGSGRTAKQVSSGWAGDCVVLDDGSIKCWGYNYYGVVGVGDTAGRGCAPNQMGDALPAASLGSSVGAPVQVGMAGVYACALFRDTGVKCWGYNDNGNLGLGDTAGRGANASTLGNNLPLVSIFP